MSIYSFFHSFWLLRTCPLFTLFILFFLFYFLALVIFSSFPPSFLVPLCAWLVYGPYPGSVDPPKDCPWSSVQLATCSFCLVYLSGNDNSTQIPVCLRETASSREFDISKRYVPSLSLRFPLSLASFSPLLLVQVKIRHVGLIPVGFCVCALGGHLFVVSASLQHISVGIHGYMNPPMMGFQLIFLWLNSAYLCYIVFFYIFVGAGFCCDLFCIL